MTQQSIGLVSMYAVKEIYYTVQCEGNQTGMPAVFIRFSGCNLWNGLESGRKSAICKFCDTDFVGTDGPGGGKFKTAEELAQAVDEKWSGGDRNKMVVCTGGEPLLQLDTVAVAALRNKGFRVSVETNGTQLPPIGGVDWLCVSPKYGSEMVLTWGNEIKLVYPQEGFTPEQFSHMDFDHFYLQPMDGPNTAENTAAAVEYCMSNAQWRLSPQVHKMIGLR